MHERIRDKLLSAWGRFVAAHPIATLAVCVPLALVNALLTVSRLEFHTDRSQLIAPDKTWNRLYAEYKENFPRYHDVTIVIVAGPTEAHGG